MPIQVVATFMKIPPPPVDLVTAGNDVFPFCDTVVTLTAVVSPPENLQGHSIIWEQLSGAVVTLINPTEIVVSYNQITNDVTDKEFRITIDKGLKEEQTDTVVVYATPTSIPITSSPSVTWNGIPSDAVIDLTVDTTASVAPPQNVRNVDVVITPEFNIIWSQPPQEDLQPFVVDYELFENDVKVATLLSTDPLIYSGGPEKYYVVTNFVVNGVAPYQSSSAKSRVEDFVDAVTPLTDAFDDIGGLSFGVSAPILTTFPNIVQRNLDTTELSFGMESSLIRFLINTVKSEESTALNSWAPAETIIVRIDPGGIGGG